MKKFYFFSCWILIIATATFSDPQYYNYNNGTSYNSFPFNQAAGKMIQGLVAPGEFNQPSGAPNGSITKFSVRISTGYPLGPVTYTQFKILFLDTNLTALPTNLVNGNWDTVYFRATTAAITAPASTWLDFTLDHPHAYDNTKSLVFQIEQCSASGTYTGFSLQHTTTGTNRRTYSAGGCPFTYGGTSLYVPNCSINVVPAIPSYYNFNTVVGTNNFPFNMSTGKMCQWLYAPGEFNQPSNAPSGYVTAAYFFMGGAGATNRVFTSFYIRMGKTAATTLPTGAWYTGPMDTVYVRPSVSLTSATGQWMMIPLDNPFLYRNDSSLVIEVGQCSYTPTTGQMWICQTSRTGFRRDYSVGGCPFAYQGQDATQAHFGIYVPTPLGVSSNNNQVPNAYKLEQNYPNPFNPTTTINFGLPKGSNVKLTVYDILGREVDVLVNEFRAPGNYSVNFDATNYASGVYLYKLEAAGFVETKKMQLIK